MCMVVKQACFLCVAEDRVRDLGFRFLRDTYSGLTTKETLSRSRGGGTTCLLKLFFAYMGSTCKKDATQCGTTYLSFVIVLTKLPPYQI